MHLSELACSRKAPVPQQAAPKGSGSGLVQALAVLLCVRAQVHSYGEPSVRPEPRRDSGAAGGELSAAGDAAAEGGCRGSSLPHGGFGGLPDYLLEAILCHLLGPGERLTHFRVCGVSRAWRQVGRQLFFASPWSEAHLICHPSQVFCLSPRPVESSRSRLLKCFLHRVPAPGGSGAQRLYSLYMGRDHAQPHHARFLMCAVQVSRGEMLVYLNREGRGAPAGRLSANAFGTAYSLGLAPGVRLLGDGCCESGFRQLKSAPQELGSLEYKAKVKGFMQPRRQEVRLPPPAALSFGPWLLPQLCREGGDLESSYHGGRSHLFNPPSFSGGGYYFQQALGKQDTGAGGSLIRAGGGAAVPTVPADAAEAEEVAGGIGAGLAGFVEQGGWGLGLEGEAGQGWAPPAPPQGQHAQHAPATGLQLLAAVPALPQHGEVWWQAPPPAGPPAQPQQAQQAQQAVAGEGSEGRGEEGQGGAGSEAWREAPLVLKNKPPVWNPELRCWCLNFRGRVKQASVKNFQLIRAGDASECTVLQFGKVERDIYAMDFDPMVVSAFQALAISLSTFNGKLML